MLPECVIGRATFGHMSGQDLAVHETAAGHTESLALIGFNEDAVDVAITSFTFFQRPAVFDDQLGLLGLIAVTDPAITVVSFKQAFFYGCHALHGVF